MNSTSVVLFITHAEVEIDPEVPVTEWGLSGQGKIRHEAFNPFLSELGVAEIYCSAEKKAIDGAAIAARHLGKDYRVLAALHENDRSATGYLPPAEFEKTADLFFTHPAQSIRGWEKAVDAQQRIVTAVESIDAGSPIEENLAIVSHGGVGALLLCYLQNLPISKALDQPGSGGGNYFLFHRRTGTLIKSWTSI